MSPGKRILRRPTGSSGGRIARRLTFDSVVARLHIRVESAAALQPPQVRLNLAIALTASGSLLFVLLLIGFLTVQSILKRIAGLKLVSDHLARADIEGLVVDISGTDEIAEFGSSL